ncbi:MAG: hypothetical protein JOZ41_19210 [Chloroflexi bacterium]|nr:hypothetical protein [Chloroflexota bacterium]
MPARLHLRAVRIQFQPRAIWTATGQGISLIRVKQRATFVIYVDQIRPVTSGGRLSFAWQVKLGSRTVAHHGKHITLRTGQGGRRWAYWQHTFSATGSYTLIASVSLKGERHAKTVTFGVVP